MRSNPYTRVLLQQAEQGRKHTTGDAAVSSPIHANSKIEEYLAAKAIPAPQKYKILTARAHALSNEELKEAISIEEMEAKQRLEHLVKLEAPEIILANERKKVANAGKSLRKILAARTK